MKRTRYVNGELDALDGKILAILSTQGRIAMKDLAAEIGLSSPSTAERVRRLEDIGAIRGYAAQIDAEKIGFSLAVYLRVQPMPGELKRCAELLAASPEIVECDRVTGDDCFVAKAYLGSVDALEKLIDRFLPYGKTNTSVIQSSPVKRRMPVLLRSDD